MRVFPHCPEILAGRSCKEPPSQETARMLTHPTNKENAPPDRRKPIRVLLVDDHPAVRAGARNVIDDQPDMRVVAEARSAAEALRQQGVTFDVAIVDYHLREGHDGLWLSAQLKRTEPSPRVLI